MGVSDGLMARYGSAAGAAAYRDKYSRSWLRRLSGRRELRLVEWALRAAGTAGPVLDVPCGAGRLVPGLLRHAAPVTALDLSEPMVAEARRALSGEIAAGRVTVAQGSADALPFPDDAFDTVVCWRLLHHLTVREDRVRVLGELRRAARRAVVVSFADATAAKARLQRWRGRDRRCVTLAPADLAAEAAEAGLALAATRRLSGLFSLLAAAVLTPAARPPRP